MNYTELFSQLTMIIGILVALVNIITEVAKKVHNFKSTESLNIFVTALSVLITFVSFVAYFQIKGLALYWYVLVAFVIIGFMVSYAAMFGFDKLIKYFNKGE